eukprot:TRINITY_DN9547_c0_g2_i1.p4 TRINITY_DN9547_c0_g2~~TRINITY_DN9547_c0_g2_i1.p4  ORF type:complete len:101 (+),score=11.42 TRINITY_DN9547_c0_g2_i1:685-987(+)
MFTTCSEVHLPVVCVLHPTKTARTKDATKTLPQYSLDAASMYSEDPAKNAKPKTNGLDQRMQSAVTLSSRIGVPQKSENKSGRSSATLAKENAQTVCIKT